MVALLLPMSMTGGSFRNTARPLVAVCWVQLLTAHYSPNGGGLMNKGVFMTRSMVGKVCEAVGLYDRLVWQSNGGASGSWAAFVAAALDDPAGICYEIADHFIELFPEYAIYNDKDADENMMDLCFEFGQRYVASLEELGGE